MNLSGKVCIVTGGASGIGRATAIKFAAEGASVVVADVNEAEGRITAEDIQRNSGRSLFVKTDVTVYSEVEQLVQTAVDTFGSLDIMFNNAGIGRYKPLLDHSPEDFDAVVKVNQYGVYYGILAAARKMRELGTAGTIINTASVFAFMASPGVIGYHAAKGAVKMMTQAAALELGEFGIRCLAIAPGGVDTPIIQGYKDMGIADKMARQHMRKQLQKPEHIANVVALLASKEADAINGSVVMVDDGFAEFK
ncbi:MAG: SDR family NAD(P)-dependent oxidoreductase [Alicyclobacillaceae bacterium]|nr:SDR family NAD(P)-dependent oxidoreductase [Alicyclobacillaceae bacterium]